MQVGITVSPILEGYQMEIFLKPLMNDLKHGALSLSTCSSEAAGCSHYLLALKLTAFSKDKFFCSQSTVCIQTRFLLTLFVEH